jgi:uncharacterized protein YjiS (DUF1127 family)
MSYTQALDLSAQPLPPLSRLLVTLALTVAAWELRHRTRKHLADLPEQMLRDIGLNPNDAAIEAEKPFWRT